MEKQPNKPKKDLKKVVTGEVTVKQKSGLEKITDSFITENSGNVKSYILMDVLVPAMKKAVYDIATNGISTLLECFGFSQYGDTRQSRSVESSSYSYGNCYRNQNRTQSNTRGGYSYNDISLENRSEAEDVLNQLDELIATYGSASVADLYNLVGVTGNYTDNKYGWTNIRTASVVRTRDGYLLKLPRALPLD